MDRASPPSGYSGTPLPVKLGIRPGQAVAVLGGPDGFADSLAAQAGVEVRADTGGGAPFDVIVFFSPWRADLESELGHLREHMAPACGLWIAWPKRAAKVPTDMSETVVREVALPTGLVDNKVCAIDATWSGLRLVIRRELRE
ncbi:MAG: hypothetical protein JWL68_5988 [Actinomycetia bacterium]|nr:hypothetical protein [Actinomycetes bacterium]